MPLTLIALSKVDDKDAGPASSLVNTGHLVGGSIAWGSKWHRWTDLRIRLRQWSWSWHIAGL